MTTQQAETHSASRPGASDNLDPITFEVIRHRLWAINDDQARMAARLASTPIVYDGYDFNAALVTADGRGLVTGVYIMHHGSTLDDFVRRLIADWPADELRPGDMFYSNDPWWGPLHHNDGVLAMPIFYGGQIVAWSGLVMHDNDVGSPVPGSFVAGASNRFDEAPLFPAVKLVEGYRIRHDIERIKLRNCRTPELNALNMRARVAALRTTEQRLGDLISHYGIDTFLAAQEGIIDYVGKVVQQRLRDIPDGAWFAQGYLDHDGRTDGVYRICCRVIKRGEQLTFDFTGTSPQASGAVNCTRPAMEGAVIGVVLISLCYDLPWTVGALRPLIKIVSEEGTINNAVGDAAVSMASVQGTLCTQDVVANAVSKMLLCTEKFRSEAQATWAPGINFGVLTAMDRGELSVEGVIDAFPGGGGARTFSDGIDSGGIYHSMASRIGNAETFESRSPVLQVYRRELTDTGGSGRYRGGVTVGFGNVVHNAGSEATLGVTASGTAMPGGFGLSGGAPGAAVSNVILRGTDVRDCLAAGRIPLGAEDLTAERMDVQQAKDFTQLGPDDFVVSVNNAGGGFGDPLLRDPEAVARDVAEGLVSRDVAERVYGVVLTGPGASGAGASGSGGSGSGGSGPGGSGADAEATTARRRALREQRLSRARPVRPGQGGGAIDGGQVLHPVADAVEAVSVDGDRLLRCSQCHRILGSYTEDYKQGTVYQDSPLTEASPLNARCRLDTYVLRQFFCPGCGTVLVTDIQAVGEPIRDECLLF
jgi:N-methylhydantoinase B/oxoprolinase/acetone carboxylase alpha subunit